jgi:uncharacterized protein (DUF1800 family)
MKLNRRKLLQTGLLAGAAQSLSGCERLISMVADQLGQSPHASSYIAQGEQIDPDFHFLSRTTYGVAPGDLDHIRAVGRRGWLDEQLNPDRINDTACDLRARRFETLHLEPGLCYEFKKNVLRQDLARHTLLRATYSRRQLHEVMTGFWSDHLNIYSEKADCIYLKTSDDRDIIRRHALGNFHELIRASATSPAMLVYLDGKENKKASPTDVPNENYARELLELHTLGVRGGYTQKDVSEVARCLTGWRLHDRWQRGKVYFDAQWHDDGEKHVLGHLIPAGGGASDLDRVVALACDHPATAQHIATKLVRYFVSETPPSSLVAAVASEFSRTRGDIKSMLRVLLLSDEFAASAGSKFKRPFHYVASALRCTAADTHAHAGLTNYLASMGQAPFEHPTPDGYADETIPWLGSLLWRWNFAFALVSNGIEGTHVDASRFTAGSFDANTVFACFVGRKPSTAEASAFSQVAAKEQQTLALGLILASPAFQRY